MAKTLGGERNMEKNNCQNREKQEQRKKNDQTEKKL